MFVARILFPLPIGKFFDYTVPENETVHAGSYVIAPFGPNNRIGVVWKVVPEGNEPNRKLKSISEVFSVPPMPETMRDFIEFVAKYTVTQLGQVLKLSLRSLDAFKDSPSITTYELTGDIPLRLTPKRKAVISAISALNLPTLSELAKEAGVSTSVVKGMVSAGALRTVLVSSDKPFSPPVPSESKKELTNDQRSAVATIHQVQDAKKFAPIVVDGVTGSGKTEVYFEAIAKALRDDESTQILILLPEIALTQAILQRFTDRFEAEPTVWHSELSDSQRRRAWREVAFGRTRIVVGARSALFLPFTKLGLIVIDEEHDTSYKQDEGVNYNGRDIAVAKAKFENACILLGSATPSLESASNTESGRYGLVTLSARPGTAKLPEIKLIDMRAQSPGKGRSLSPTLVNEIRETAQRGEQSLLFINRRGYAPLVLCKSCGEKLMSPDTHSWLTEHLSTGRLVCHLTGYSIPKPKKCPKCDMDQSLIGIGPGVERVAEEVVGILPNANVEIFSSDTTQTPEDTKKMIERMAQGEIDVLVGTQIVAKGHNFPNLTLVGVVDGDSGIKGGDPRAGERTFQLLSQVAGRAGRAEKPGRAFIQTYSPDNPAMIALAAGDRDGFMKIERDMRSELGLPPFGRLAALIVSAPSVEEANEAGRTIAQNAPNAKNVKVFGPAPAPITMIRGRHRRRFLVQSPKNVDLSAYMATWKKSFKLSRHVRVNLDIDPYSFL